MSHMVTFPSSCRLESTTSSVSTFCLRMSIVASANPRFGRDVTGGFMTSAIVGRLSSLRSRFSPMKSRTKSLAGWRKICSGVPSWTMSPSLRMQIRLAIFRASAMSCVTNRIVFDTVSCNRSSSSWSCSRLMGSRALNGSSMRMIGGSAAMARITPIRCCCPPLNS